MNNKKQEVKSGPITPQVQTNVMWLLWEPNGKHYPFWAPDGLTMEEAFEIGTKLYKCTPVKKVFFVTVSQAPKAIITPPHPEDHCAKCGGKNTRWYAPNKIWNSVMRDKDRLEDKWGIICPQCFLELADVKYPQRLIFTVEST